MSVCANPQRRREARQIATGTVVLFLEESSTSVVGELKDLSYCGLSIKHSPTILRHGQIFKINYNHEEKSVRAVWVQNADGCSFAGLLNQEVYLIDRLIAGEKELFSQLVAPY